MKENAVFTNVALTDDGDVWWEGLSDAPAHLTDWKGNDWTPESSEPAAHPNSRFCVPMTQAPTVALDWDRAEGFELDAILFGGRRATNVPLVSESRDWNHGVFMGATIASEQTAAAEGPVGQLRRDPFAMLPFCGYNMADYWNHWLKIGNEISNPPKIFQVNWFRKDENGRIMWPGFSENTRVIDWIIGRLENKNKGQATPIGRIPANGELNIEGLELDEKTMQKIMDVDSESWLAETKMIESFFDGFGLALPEEMTKQLHWLRGQLEIQREEELVKN
jgi:phosphoenolpyruvate carboxykinase (GTP)